MAVTSMSRSSIANSEKRNGMKVPPPGYAVFQYGVVAGGGAANLYGGAGGGGFRSSYSSTNSGGAQINPENQLFLQAGSYTVTVGAGGASSARGGDSTFATVTSIGGGSAQGYGGTVQSGGSGGGATGNASRAGGAGTVGQGGNGGNTSPDGYGGYNQGAGGGAAGSASNTNRGAGVTTSQFTGSSVTYSEGGGPTGSAKTVANDGHGNNGGSNTGRNGNPGLVSITTSSDAAITIGAGLTYTATAVGSDTRYVFTAGTGNITIGAI